MNITGCRLFHLQKCWLIAKVDRFDVILVITNDDSGVAFFKAVCEIWVEVFMLFTTTPSPQNAHRFLNFSSCLIILLELLIPSNNWLLPTLSFSDKMLSLGSSGLAECTGVCSFLAFTVFLPAWFRFSVSCDTSLPHPRNFLSLVEVALSSHWSLLADAPLAPSFSIRFHQIVKQPRL